MLLTESNTGEIGRDLVDQENNVMLLSPIQETRSRIATT
jgi:hypothetical protein